MLEKFFLWFASFFGILSIFGIYLGYLHLIYSYVSFVVIVLSGVGAYFVVRRFKGVKLRYSRHIGMILFFLLALDMYVSLPYLIYPHSYVDFGMNVARGRLVSLAHGFPDMIHVYPNVHNGVFALFNSIVLHAYSVASIIAIVFQVMTVLVIFLIGKELFDEKTGLIASFLYGFSFINILLLEQGYLTQNFGTFFFASSMYLIIMCNKSRSYVLPLLLSFVGLISYPHYFAIISIVVLIYFRKLFRYVIAAILLLSPEVVGMGFYYLTHFQSFANSFVMSGGILVPNLFVLSVFVLGLFGFLVLKNGMRNSAVVYFAVVIGGVMSLFVILFLINSYIFTWRTPGMHQLYIVVKLLYLLLVPVSILAAGCVKKCIMRNIPITLVFLLLYFSFFVNYSIILNQKNNLPHEIYFSSEVLNQMNQNYSLGFDRDMFQDDWSQPWIYDTLYGREDNYTTFSGYELVFLLQSYWFWDEQKGNHRLGNINVSYSMEDVDYFVTLSDDLNEDVYYSIGKLRIYSFG